MPGEEARVESVARADATPRLGAIGPGDAACGVGGGSRRAFDDVDADLVELRLSRAVRELLATENSIADVAFGSGFSNLANFNRLFRRRYGTSPREYRVRAEVG